MTPLWFDGPVVASDIVMENDSNANDKELTLEDDMELSDIDEYVISSDSDDSH